MTFGARGELIGAYACARIQATGVTYVEAMNIEDLQKAAKASKSRDKNGNLVGPWVEWTDRMYQKTCLHRICKRLPNVALPDDEEFQPENRISVAQEPAAPTQPSGNGRPAALQRVVDTDRKPAAKASLASEPPEEPPPLEEPM